MNMCAKPFIRSSEANPFAVFRRGMLSICVLEEEVVEGGGVKLTINIMIMPFIIPGPGSRSNQTAQVGPWDHIEVDDQEEEGSVE